MNYYFYQWQWHFWQHHITVSDDAGLGLDLDNNKLDKTSVTGEHVQNHANDDEGLTIGDFEQDAIMHEEVDPV